MSTLVSCYGRISSKRSFTMNVLRKIPDAPTGKQSVPLINDSPSSASVCKYVSLKENQEPSHLQRCP